MDETPEAPDETDAPSSGRSLLPWQRNAIQLGAVAAVISAILAVTANLSEIMGWFAPDQTREIVVRTQSTVEDTDAKVNELLTLLRNQAAVNGVELDIESERAEHRQLPRGGRPVVRAHGWNGKRIAATFP